MCDCIEKMDAKLAELNGRLGVTFNFPRDGSPSYTLPTLVVEKIKPRGKKPPIALPSFCPFCGEKYERPAPPQSGDE